MRIRGASLRFFLPLMALHTAMGGFACQENEIRLVEISVRFLDANREPIEGVPVSLNRESIGKSDAHGALEYAMRAAVGDQIALRFAKPKGLHLKKGESRVKSMVVGEFIPLDEAMLTNAGPVVETLEWEVVLTQKRIRVPLVVESDCPHLAVSLFPAGREEEARTIGFTNREGVRLLSATLPLDQKFRLRLITDPLAEVSPANPTSELFEVVDNPRPYRFRQAFVRCDPIDLNRTAYLNIRVRPEEAGVYLVDEASQRETRLKESPDAGFAYYYQEPHVITLRIKHPGYRTQTRRMDLQPNPEFPLQTHWIYLDPIGEERALDFAPSVEADTAQQEIKPPKRAAKPLPKLGEAVSQRPAPTPAQAKESKRSSSVGSIRLRSNPPGIEIFEVRDGREKRLGKTTSEGLTLARQPKGSYLFKWVNPESGFAKWKRLRFQPNASGAVEIFVDMEKAEAVHRQERIWKDYLEVGRLASSDRGFLATLPLERPEFEKAKIMLSSQPEASEETLAR